MRIADSRACRTSRGPYSIEYPVMLLTYCTVQQTSKVSICVWPVTAECRVRLGCHACAGRRNAENAGKSLSATCLNNMLAQSTHSHNWHSKELLPHQTNPMIRHAQLLLSISSEIPPPQSTKLSPSPITFQSRPLSQTCHRHHLYQSHHSRLHHHLFL